MVLLCCQNINHSCILPFNICFHQYFFSFRPVSYTHLKYICRRFASWMKVRMIICIYMILLTTAFILQIRSGRNILFCQERMELRLTSGNRSCISGTEKDCTGICVISETGCVKPVSYTHLDVYKRQVQTHNARDAIKSAWGVEVNVADNGTLSLR